VSVTGGQNGWQKPRWSSNNNMIVNLFKDWRFCSFVLLCRVEGFLFLIFWRNILLLSLRIPWTLEPGLLTLKDKISIFLQNIRKQ
jgi:hypothetical protein